MPRVRFRLAGVLILGLAFWARVADLYSQPVFVDEANHLAWIQQFASGVADYPIFLDGKFLLGPVVALLQPVGPAPLWLGRVALALTGLFSVAACLAGGALLGSRKAGALAGLFYAVLPLAVAHERQLLADPLMAAFGSLAFVFTLKLAQARRPLLPALLLGAALGLAFSAKFIGGVYLILPALGALWFGRVWRQAGALAVAALFTVLLFGALYPRWGRADQRLAAQQVGFLGCPPLVCQGDLPAQVENLGHALRSLSELAPSYVSVALVALALVALRAHIAHKRASFVAAGLAGMVLVILAVGRDIPPRYLVFMAAPVAMLAAHGVAALSRKSFAGACALALLCLGPLANTGLLVFHPAKAALPNLDRQSFDNGAMAIGVHRAAQTILAREASAVQPPVVLVQGVHFNSVAAYFDPTRIDVRRLNEAFPADLGTWLVRGQRIYLVEESPPGEEEARPGLIVAPLGRYGSGAGGVASLWLVSGVQGDTREAIYQKLFMAPQTLAPEYQALAASLPETEPLTLLVYPPHQTEALSPLLASRPNVTLHPLADVWPPVISVRDEALLDDAPLLNAVFLEETTGDPQRALETWLYARLFHLDQQWFGPIRMVRFAGPGGAGQVIPVAARFGDAITLESIEVFDPVAMAGGVLRLRYTWQAAASVAEQYKVFTHLYDEAGIAAQYDGQPVGELRPTHTWQAGEQIVDQFAIRLPAETPPGVYQLRIGMYDLNTQARLPVVLAAGGAAGEFFVGGQIVVDE